MSALSRLDSVATTFHGPEIVRSQIQTRYSNNNFDFLRFAFAVTVIFSHCYPLLYGAPSKTEPLIVATSGQFDLGTLAVCGFFLISGYLISGSWHRCGSLAKYVGNRFRRIYPGYVIAMLTCALIVAPITCDAPHDVASFLMKSASWLKRMLTLWGAWDATAFQANPHPYAINGSLWTIRYEAYCYALVPLFTTMARRLGRWTVFIPTAIFVLLADNHVRVPWFHETMPLVCGCFMVGMCVWLYRDAIRWSPVAFLVCVAALLAASRYGHMTLLVPTAGAYVLFAVAFSQSSLNDFGRHGDYSYGIYLYAFPIQQLLIMFNCCASSPLILFCSSTALSLIAGFASWHLIEKRFLTRSSSRATALAI